MNVQPDTYTTKKTGTGSKAVFGIVPSAADADKIVSELKRAGFRNDDISALFPDKQGSRDFAHEKNTKAPEGAVAGASIGGLVGGTLGLLAGIGALAIPGLGPLIAAGPIMAAMSGLAAGAALGGLSGGLIGLGVPEIEAKQYESKVRDGNILLSVHVDDGEWRKKAKTILEAGGATDIATVGEASVPGASTTGNNYENLSTLAKQIRPNMPVVCSNGGQFAVIDHMEGAHTVKLNRDASGTHHYMPLSWVTRVDDKVHVDRPGDQAMREWSTSPSMS